MQDDKDAFVKTQGCAIAMICLKLKRTPFCGIPKSAAPDQISGYRVRLMVELG